MLLAECMMKKSFGRVRERSTRKPHADPLEHESGDRAGKMQR
jgi:hypothetical protein